jgi:hypothetical protein
MQKVPVKKLLGVKKEGLNLRPDSIDVESILMISDIYNIQKAYKATGLLTTKEGKMRVILWDTDYKGNRIPSDDDFVNKANARGTKLSRVESPDGEVIYVNSPQVKALDPAGIIARDKKTRIGFDSGYGHVCHLPKRSIKTLICPNHGKPTTSVEGGPV